MLPPNPLLLLAPLRVQRGVQRLRELIWTDFLPVAVSATAPAPEAPPFAAARRLPRQPVAPGEAWGRLYDARWCRIDLPSVSRRDGRRWLHWQEQGEATLYLEGRPFYGFDVAHRSCELPAGVRDAWVLAVCVQAAIWHPDATGLSREGSVFGGARLSRRDNEAWAAYHDLLCLAELMLDQRQLENPGEPRELSVQRAQTPLLRASPFYRRLLRGLDEALDALDTRGVAALSRRLAALYAELRERRPLVDAVLTGHSHLDLVWLWPERIGELKAVHTFANVDRLLARYPEFRFAYSQPASYEAVARREPALAARVRRHVRAGRWEPTGGTWVESDSHLACGEALLRSFELGQEGFSRLRGSPSRVLWLPDLFGFNACLPQLMRLHGIPYFFTTKTIWNLVNPFPHSSFVWRGPGGHEVLAHVTSEIGFNNTVSVPELRSAARSHRQADQHPELLFPCGYGDGGGGPTEEMAERARRLSALGDLPAVAWGQPEAFFDRLAPLRSRLPVHDGEIYLEAHRGVYTTHRRLKRAFRGLERALQVREAAAAALGQSPDLGHAWRRLVFAQFHDYIPGSSIPEVYHEGLPELEGLAAGLLGEAGAALGRDPAGAPCLFNPLALPREVVHRGRLLSLPPLAGVRLDDTAPSLPAPPVLARGRTLDNGLVRVRVDARGHLADVAIRGRRLALRPGAGSLVLFPDQPAAHDAWEIDRWVLSLGRTADGAASVSAEDDALVVRRRLGRASSAVLRYRLEPGSPVLRLSIELDWQEPHTLLKLVFPTDCRAPTFRCGLPFGATSRPQVTSTKESEGMWEVPASRWVSLADEDGSGGIALVTESHYGFGCRDGLLTVTLVRSPLHVGFDSFTPAYPPGLSRIPAPPAPQTDLGRHTMEFALAAVEADTCLDEQPAALAETLFTPPVPYLGAPLAPTLVGVRETTSLVPSWARPLADGRWLLRLHEVAGGRGRARLALARGWSARRCDPDGRRPGPALRGGALSYRPYDILSVLLSPASGTPPRR